jgi:multiple sugar transport system substrate-binding protein
MAKKVSRREFLRLASLAAAGGVVAACAPQAAPEKEVVEVEVTRIVEVEGETVVEEVLVTVPPEMSVTIEFWTMNYGDPEQWVEMFRGWSADFQAETGITADVQMINWANAMNTWLLVSSGGAHPDAADMFWLYSFTELGGGEYGPMPITEYQPILWPDLEDRFFAGSLKDVLWKGDFYGIPWRGDIRPILYRTDFLEEAGFDAPPDTWEEVTEMAQALTKRDSSGNVTQWGFCLGSSVPMQQFLQYIWQAGGEYMTADGKTATLDTPEMRECLQWIYDLLWTYEVHPTDFMEQGYAPGSLFQGGQMAIIGSVPDDMAATLERDFPELDGLWNYAIPTMGPANRASYSGAGYWGVLRGTTKVEESARWIQHLSQDEILETLAQYLGRVSPNKKVMASPFWTDKEWKQVIVQTLEYAHTSQHPSPAWSKVVANDPGAVLYDMYYEALVLKEPFDDVLARAQQRMQEEMDKIA